MATIEEKCFVEIDHSIVIIVNLFSNGSTLLFELDDKISKGVDDNVDKKEALKYYKIAADHKNPNAMDIYALLLQDRYGVQIDQ